MVMKGRDTNRKCVITILANNKRSFFIRTLFELITQQINLYVRIFNWNSHEIVGARSIMRVNTIHGIIYSNSHFKNAFLHSVILFHNKFQTVIFFLTPEFKPNVFNWNGKSQWNGNEQRRTISKRYNRKKLLLKRFGVKLRETNHVDCKKLIT